MNAFSSYCPELKVRTNGRGKHYMPSFVGHKNRQVHKMTLNPNLILMDSKSLDLSPCTALIQVYHFVFRRFDPAWHHSFRFRISPVEPSLGSTPQPRQGSSAGLQCRCPRQVRGNGHTIHQTRPTGYPQSSSVERLRSMPLKLKLILYYKS